MESKARQAKTLLRVLALGFGVIFIGGELADALIARMPDHAELIRTCVAAVVGAVVIVVAMPLVRRKHGDQGPGGKGDPPSSPRPPS